MPSMLPGMSLLLFVAILLLRRMLRLETRQRALECMPYSSVIGKLLMIQLTKTAHGLQSFS